MLTTRPLKPLRYVLVALQTCVCLLGISGALSFAESMDLETSGNLSFAVPGIALGLRKLRCFYTSLNLQLISTL
jgi:hypothetical protein